MAGLTRDGLTIKTQDEVQTDLREQAAVIFSDLTPSGDVVDTSDNSTLGRMIGVITPELALLWEMMQEVYTAFNPNTATGVQLDNIIALSGITRLPAVATRAQVLLEGDFNTVILSPQGSAMSSTTQRPYSIPSAVILNEIGASGVGLDVAAVQNSTVYTFSYTTDGAVWVDTTITSRAAATRENILADLKTQVDSLLAGLFTTSYKDGKLFVSRTDPFQIATFKVTVNLKMDKIQKLGVAVDDEVGPYVQVAHSIDTIAVPIVGWDSIINPVAALTGRFTETDEQLRERFRNSKFFQSQNTLESLIDAIRNVENVTDVVIYENDTDTTDPATGVTPHAFKPIVLGGLPTEVGQAIWENKPTGIQSVGTTAVQITDSQQLGHTVRFQRPIEVPIYVSMTIRDIGGMPGDAATLIRQNILDAVEDTLFIGDDVIYSRLYTPINAVPGHMVESLLISANTWPAPGAMSNIVIDYNAVAMFAAERISVTVVT